MRSLSGPQFEIDYWFTWICSVPVALALLSVPVIVTVPVVPTSVP